MMPRYPRRWWLLSSSASSSPRQQDDRMLLFSQSVDRLLYFVSGLAVGFISASFVVLVLQSPPSSSTSLLMLPSRPVGEDNDGWKDIHVFVGDDAELRQEQMLRASAIPHHVFSSRQWFSQAQQDELVAGLFHYKRSGYFVDLAANDAVRISNTFALERDYGWHGIAIEPNPVYWAGLVHRPQAHIVAAVVAGQQRDTRAFRFPKEKAPQGGLVSATQNSQAQSHQDNAEIQMQPTVSLAEILDRYQAPNVIDYLSLDCEGAETLVLADFPFHQYQFNIMTIERPNTILIQTLESHGYQQLKRLKQWGETLWAHQTVLENLDLSFLALDTQNYKYSEKLR